MRITAFHLLTVLMQLSAFVYASTINVPADYSTIQAALTAAQSGDTVLVQPGTYYENIFWPDVNGIKLISAGDSSNTIIDGGGVSSVVYMNPVTSTIDSNTIIQGFKITNGGNIANGGGMFISSASPLLTRLWVSGNSASYSGGGLYINDSSPTLTYVTVTSNTAADRGGGLYIYSGSPTLTYVTVTGNTATASIASAGGGLYIINSSPTLTDVSVTGNSATGDSGGLCIKYGNPTLTDVTVTGNTAFGHGGGLLIDSCSPTLTYVTVTGNTANKGGGLYIGGANPILINVIVTANSATRDGGGLYINGSPTLTDVTVIGNTATRNGGGLYISSGSPTLTDVSVTGNTAGSTGGGLSIYSGSPTLTRITVSRNLGAGLYYSGGSGALVNVTITGNTSGIYVESGAPNIAGSNIAYNGTGLYNADNINIVDADSVWWGDPSGPYHPQHNLGGLGDSVNAFVNITPWLTEPDTDAPPIPVQNLAIDSTGTDFISLSWDTNPIGDLAGYKIYYDSDSSGYPYANSLDVGTVTSYTLSGLSLITDQYFIAMTCYDSDGNESWYSSEAATSIIDIVPPASPQNLSAQAGDKQVTLTWTANTENDFLRYRIYGGTTANPTTAIDSTESALDTTITISGLDNDMTYYFRITAVDSAGNYSGFSAEVSAIPVPLAVDSDVGVPGKFALHQNYPNPFNPSTTLQFDLPEAADVYLVVYDLLGREVVRLVDRPMAAGYHRVIWNGCDRVGRYVPSGIYIVRVRSTNDTKAIKIILMK